MARLRDLRRRFPTDVHVHRAYQDVARVDDADGIREEYAGLRSNEPEDPMLAYLHARVAGRDGAEIVEAALAAHPEYPWLVWARSVFLQQEDPPQLDRAFEYLERFMEICPKRFMEPLLYATRVGPSDFWRQRLPQLRQLVESAPALEALGSYSRLWALEFKTRSPTDHETSRQAVRVDLERLRSLDLHDNRTYLAVLENGYELAGDPESLEALRTSRAESFPCDLEVTQDVVEKWLEEHSGAEPSTTLSPALAEELYRDSAAWVERCPESYGYWISRFRAVENLAEIGDADLRREIDGYLSMWETQKDQIGTSRTPTRQAIELLLERQLDLEKLPALMAKERAYAKERIGPDPQALPERLRDRVAEGNLVQDLELELLAARVHMATERTSDASHLFDAVESRLGELASMSARGERQVQSLRARILGLRADLAVGDDRLPDAVVFLRQAAAAVPEGEARTGYLSRALDLWQQMGGSEETFRTATEVASTRGSKTADTLGVWEPKNEPLAPFELVDLAGETWTNEDLEGQTVLINVWATWCGPCRVELPHLEKLQEELRNHEEVRILTFNVDDNPGLILPYLENEGLAFDVLLAERHIREVQGGFSIPQNWIVDAAGQVRLTQLGFSAEGADRWLDETRQAIESVVGEGKAP